MRPHLLSCGANGACFQSLQLRRPSVRPSVRPGKCLESREAGKSGLLGHLCPHFLAPTDKHSSRSPLGEGENLKLRRFGILILVPKSISHKMLYGSQAYIGEITDFHSAHHATITSWHAAYHLSRPHLELLLLSQQ